MPAPARPLCMQRLLRHLYASSIASIVAALALTAPAGATLGVDYAIDASINDHSGAIVVQDREFNTGQLPLRGLQFQSASRLDADGYAIGHVSFDATNGRLGYLANTLSGTSNKAYLLNLASSYDDAISIVSTARQPGAATVTLRMKIEGDLAGSATQGAVTMRFSAATGQSAFLQLSRRPDSAHPGFDTFMTWSDVTQPPTLSLVTAGTTAHFVETLSLVIPMTAVPAASQGITTRGLCVGHPPGCGVAIDQYHAIPAPTVDFSFDVNVSSASGRGMPLGDSLIDLSHTASLDVEVPDDAYFLLMSGALSTSAKSAYAILPVLAVPEPSPAALLLAGATLLSLRRHPWRRRTSESCNFRSDSRAT